MTDFSVDITALREFARHVSEEVARVPESDAVTCQPGFGHASHWGAHLMWRSHNAARAAMAPLLDQIKGGSLASESAIHKVIENYTKADDTARERIDAVNRAVGDFRAAPVESQAASTEGHAGESSLSPHSQRSGSGDEDILGAYGG